MPTIPSILSQDYDNLDWGGWLWYQMLSWEASLSVPMIMLFESGDDYSKFMEATFGSWTFSNYQAKSYDRSVYWGEVFAFFIGTYVVGYFVWLMWYLNEYLY